MKDSVIPENNCYYHNELVTTKCPTDNCKSCRVLYSNEIVGLKLICRCTCHFVSDESDINNRRQQTKSLQENLIESTPSDKSLMTGPKAILKIGGCRSQKTKMRTLPVATKMARYDKDRSSELIYSDSDDSDTSLWLGYLCFGGLRMSKLDTAMIKHISYIVHEDSSRERKMYNTARTNIINPIAENIQLCLSYFLLTSSLAYPLNSSLSTKVIENNQNDIFSFQHATRTSSCVLLLF
jgi:hypothetical protein